MDPVEKSLSRPPKNKSINAGDCRLAKLRVSVSATCFRYPAFCDGLLQLARFSSSRTLYQDHITSLPYFAGRCMMFTVLQDVMHLGRFPRHHNAAKHISFIQAFICHVIYLSNFSTKTKNSSFEVQKLIIFFPRIKDVVKI